MPSQEVLSEILETFRSEGADLLKEIGDQLLIIEQTADQAARETPLEIACSSAHTLKGGASMLDLLSIESLVHAVEDLLVSMREGTLKPIPEVIDLILSSIDRVAELVQQSNFESQELSDEDNTLMSRLRKTLVANGIEPTALTDTTSKIDEETSGVETALPSSRPLPESSKKAPSADADSLVRISQRKIDALLDYIGELVEMKIRMEMTAQVVRDVNDRLEKVKSPEVDVPRKPLIQLSDNIGQDILYLGKLLGEIQEELRDVRMAPVNNIFPGLRRSFRDTCRKLGIEAQLHLSGGDVEIGRSILDELKSALVHLMRNAVAHGLESRDKRIEKGKTAVGEVHVNVMDRNNSVLIEVTDDGGGIDFDAVFAKAKQTGAYGSDVKRPSESELTRMLYMSGLSTSDKTDRVSGRGIGLDSVKRSVEKLKGTITLQTTPQKGTTFSIVLPLSLTTNTGLVVELGDLKYVMPRSAVDRAVAFTSSDVIYHNGQAFLEHEGEHVTMAKINRDLAVQPFHGGPGEFVAMLVRSAESSVAIVVDRILGESEIMVRDLGSFVTKIDKIAGVTVTVSGEMQFVLNPPEVVRAIFNTNGSQSNSGSGGLVPTQKTILIVDDSATSRSITQQLLASSGYRVVSAADGTFALQLLMNGDYDLVLSDIEMPQMDGFELTRRIKSNSRLQSTPVVLLTTLADEAMKRRGLESGADRYLVKRELTHALLSEVMEELV